MSSFVESLTEIRWGRVIVKSIGFVTLGFVAKIGSERFLHVSNENGQRFQLIFVLGD
jgi:hypothetical protein